jgi:FkbM family methyltransferase
MSIFFKAICCLAILLSADNYIVVNKQGVIHKFARFGGETDHFTGNVFHSWENDTFEVFEQVKNKEDIAIDLGAWIGTTSIWLAKNFNHVISVEADKVSVECLKKNLEASECPNVTVCSQPVADTSRTMIFGPLGTDLNQSISCIKEKSNHPLDYQTKSITFKQLLFDHIFSNEALKYKNISFIKCDIEGGEENIIEDMLHFAYYNNAKVYLSFHRTWWTKKTIEEFEYLFQFFDIRSADNSPITNVCEYIKEHPFASLLFIPNQKKGVLVKKNLTAFIIARNLVTYIKNMVNQLEKYTNDIVIIDNASNFEPLLTYYQDEYRYCLLRMKENFYSSVWTKNEIQKLAGDIYIITDPDLQLNPNLPQNFIDELITIQNHFQVERCGFALNHTADDIRTDVTIGPNKDTIYSWEAPMWIGKQKYPLNENLEIYSAGIDTTFCIINKHLGPGGIRVAGNYTCLHLPWHKGFQDKLLEGEYESYLHGNPTSNWFKLNCHNFGR